jgi:Family of unknown function (DUF6492)
MNSARRISAIMALKIKGRHYPHNIGRCDILFQSLRQFMDKELISEFLIIIPAEEEDEIRRHAENWKDFPIRLIREDKYLEKFKEFSKWYEVRPWHRQQIIKLFCAELVVNDYFIIFDPDMFATRSFGYNDLIVDGKALIQTEPKSDHIDWWESSAKVLGLPVLLNTPGLCVTPEILSKHACQELTRYISAKHQKTWNEVLLSMYTINWTEYTLYWSYLEANGKLENYHVFLPRLGGLKVHSEQNIWLKNEYENFDFKRLFSEQNRGLFCTIQSNTSVTPQAIAKAIKPWLPVQLQKYKIEIDRLSKVKEFLGAVIRKAMQKLGL